MSAAMPAGWDESRRVDSCDVVVVGAGILGALVAARCASEGRETAVLEALEVADGATGRCTGLVLGGMVDYYATAVARFGRDLARDMWQLTIEGRRQLIEIAEGLGVPIQRTGSLAVATGEREAEALSSSARLLQEDDFDIWFAYSDPLTRGFRAALRSPNDVTINAAELTQALLEPGVGSKPVVVHEGTEVHHIEAEQDCVRVSAHGRTVLCETCIIAADGYAQLLMPYFADKVITTRGLTLATEPLSIRSLDRPCCAHYGTIYCRQLPDRRLLLGIWQPPRAAEDTAKDPGAGAAQDLAPDEQLAAELTTFAARHFPEIHTHSVERWIGVSGLTADGLPLVGELTDLPGVYFALGLGARGLALAPVTAERVTDLALYGSTPGLLSAARLE